MKVKKLLWMNILEIYLNNFVALQILYDDLCGLKNILFFF